MKHESQSVSPKKGVFPKKEFINYSQIFFGTLIMAVGLVFFISPYKLAPGGVYGISIILHHLYKMYHASLEGFFGGVLPDNLDISIAALCLEAPLCVAGIIALGKAFGIKTVISFLTLALFTFILENLWGYSPLVDDIMLSTIFGAVCLGLGCGLIFRTGASSGGTDVISMIFSKKLHIQLGTMVIMVDSCVVLLSFVAFNDIKIPLYSFIVIYITGRIVNAAVYGFRNIKTLLIVSDKHEEIARFILDLDRGGTILYGQGMYTGNKKNIIFSNVNPKEVNLIRQHIRKVDPDAFITIIDAGQVVGEGFHSIHES
ncbi:MAG: YitT family protein [Prevotellaceae bacterium]|jgi:uncharacterized membrane-anchored protein YitT (DUF2179 family)|nr:YitT family protein [Prevotellaceae bacterium]